MKLVYYKSDIGNFGDDLNPYIFSKLFDDFSKYDKEMEFIGIGSILDKTFLNNHTKEERYKIIFGSGIREFNFELENRDKYDIFFVRGPISAKIIGDVEYITDSAYCIKLVDKDIYDNKEYEIAYMPYFMHIDRLNWKLFEKISGIKVILPNQSVEKILDDIKKSKRIVTTAMHGAIIADAYRIPWVRCKIGSQVVESDLTTELKWFDWYNTVGFQKINTIKLEFSLYKHNSFNLFKIIKDIYKIYAIKKVIKKNVKYNLSDEIIFNKNLERLSKKVENFKNKYSFLL